MAWIRSGGDCKPAGYSIPTKLGGFAISSAGVPDINTRPFTKQASHTWAVITLLSIHAVLLAYSATQHSPTMLEPAFLASGISHWQLGRFELYRVNPPLVRMVAALPLLAIGCKTDWSRFYDGPGSRAEFPVGEDFIKANGPRSIPLLFYARWACIPFSLAGGYFAWRWARELYGSAAGLLTLTLYCFEPNLLAHAELITPDAACTSFGVAAGYFFWKWLREPTWFRVIPAGFFLGLAELSKMSWIILLGLWPILWLTWRLQSVSRAPSAICRPAVNSISVGSGSHGPNASLQNSSVHQPTTLQLTAILLLALYILNLGYAFESTGTRLKDFTFVSNLMTGHETAGMPGNRFAGHWLGHLPIPVPQQYLLGFDTQKRDFEDFGQPSYLRGEWKQGGWWYYYLYGLLIKVPCGILILLGWVSLSRACRFFTHRSGVCTYARLYNLQPDQQITCHLRDELILLVPPLCLLALVSSQTGFNHHFRYVLPSLALLLVFVGQSISLLTHRFRPATIAYVLIISHALTSALSAYPHQLAYFNDFVGGTKNGYKHLAGSNLDWGQDLLFLDKWLAEKGLDRGVRLSFPGAYDPLSIFTRFVDSPMHLSVANLQWIRAEQVPFALSKSCRVGDGSYQLSARSLQVLFPDAAVEEIEIGGCLYWIVLY